MAKKKTIIENPFAKTGKSQTTPEPDKAAAWIQAAKDGKIPDEGATKPTGVGIKESELALFKYIADQLGDAASVHAVMRYGLRYFLAAYFAGEVDPAKDVRTPEPKKKLFMP